MKHKVNIFWFRRDLRLNDNHALFQALNAGLPVLPIFIFDTHITSRITNKDDARITFIHKTVSKLKSDLENLGASLKVYYDTPREAFDKLLSAYEIIAVFANEDYEPYGMERDKTLLRTLLKQNVHFKLYNDHIIFKPGTILKDNGDPYTVFTPYSKRWAKTYEDPANPLYPSETLLHRFIKTSSFESIPLGQMGFRESRIPVPALEINRQTIVDYAKKRDIPGIAGTTRLGVHLRFGTVSIRMLTQLAGKLSETFFKELIWRNFFIDVLWHFPHVVERSFKPKYDFIEWRNNEKEFELWCKGLTGYPLVDAGMRELNSTGFMHNRVRMVVAGFLTKHLLIDWRWGEAYFAEKLLDYELASNNGNWQWAAGSGCDAAPYFRVFNPETQQKKFDPKCSYIDKWVPEFGTNSYPPPLVEHKSARERALYTYKNALG